MNPDFLKPKGFYEKLREATATPPSLVRSAEWTQWFAERMRHLAEQEEMYCQNFIAHELGESVEKEWMNVDHVFVDGRKGYDQFPLIVIEHENGGFGTTKPDMGAGRLVDPAAAKASIEWAFWKCLSVRAKLNVLVAYPWEEDRDLAMYVFNRIASGWASAFKTDQFNCLVLLGWWKGDKPVSKDGELYEPFFVAPTASLCPLRKS